MAVETLGFNRAEAIFEEQFIVYHPAFKSEALRLADHRRQISGIKVIAAETNEVYNEFSGGKSDPGAIRDMAKLLFQRNPDFRYLLLFGDGSYDYKGLVKDIPAENLGVLLFAVMDGLQVQWLMEPEKVDMAQIFRVFVGLLKK